MNSLYVYVVFVLVVVDLYCLVRLKDCMKYLVLVRRGSISVKFFLDLVVLGMSIMWGCVGLLSEIMVSCLFGVVNWDVVDLVGGIV